VFGEPGHRASQHTNRGDRFLIGAYLGVGDPGVIVNHCVQECNSEPRLIITTTFTGAMGGLLPVVFASLSAEELVPATVGDVGELGDVDVNQRPGMSVLIASQGFAGHAIDVR
jgi:hypothetical protein